MTCARQYSFLTIENGWSLAQIDNGSISTHARNVAQQAQAL
jgi:hypothetical protein